MHYRSPLFQHAAPLLVAIVSASCSEPQRIEKEPEAGASTSDQEAHEAQGAAIETPVESKSESAFPLVAETPKHLATAPAPGAKAWTDAAVIPSRDKGCEVRRIESFVRVRCGGGNRIEQLVGDTRSVKFGCFDGGDPKCAVFRLEPGERRVLQFESVGFQGEWEGGFSLSKVALVSAWWPANATEPRIVID